MFRNDYRRALIMLRSLRQSVSGYVRLERRTLMGSMQFTVNGAGQDEALYALLLYEQGGLWRACMLDRLGQPRYGQCGALCRFDPRNICGRALEDYVLVAVASLQENVCELLLAGYLNGTVLTDWQQVKQAVCQAVAADRAAHTPREDAASTPLATSGLEEPAPPVPAIAIHSAESNPSNEKQTAEPEEESKTEEDSERGGESEENARPTFAEPQQNASDQTESLIQDELDQPAIPLPEAAETADASPDEFDTPAKAIAETPKTAGELLGIDLSVPWPTGIEPLRALFENLPARKPFEAEGFTLIEAPLAVPGVERCVIGISAANGRPARVLYAVPGQYAPEPPSNLAGYEWRGEGDKGYWVTIRSVE